MLLSRLIPVMLTALALVLAATPGSAAPANECKLTPDVDPDGNRLGRPCLQLDLAPASATGDATCVSEAALPDSAPDLFDDDPVCTFYIILNPFTDGGRVGAELSYRIVWAETNNVPGLQTGTAEGVPDTDQPVLIL